MKYYNFCGSDQNLEYNAPTVIILHQKLKHYTMGNYVALTVGQMIFLCLEPSYRILRLIVRHCSSRFTLRKTKELLQSEKEKTLTAKDMIEECRDKLRQAEQERDYALSHQKKVEIPVEKPVLYQKCQNCNQTAYLKAKERYDTQREKLAGRYKTKAVMYEALMFLLIWYSVSTTLFQMIRSKVFIYDCMVFFDTIATFV